jgi:hypothetical protein
MGRSPKVLTRGADKATDIAIRRARSDYFGTTVWLSPGVPGGGITGMVPAQWDRSGVWMAGSTAAGGFSVPYCRDSRSLRVVLPVAGA